MSISYPRKQTVIIFVICVLVVGGAFVYSKMENSTAFQTQDAVIVEKNSSTTTQEQVINTGTDWKKEFFANIKSGDDYKTVSGTDDSTDKEPDTLTDRLGRDFFSKFMLLQQNDLANDEASIKKVVDQTLNELISSAPQSKVYSDYDIVISVKTGAQAERDYVNAISNILVTYMPKNDAATIANQALEQNDQEMIKQIDPIVESYSKMLSNLSNTPVPQSLSKYHKNILNAISSMLFVSQGMKNVFADPAQSLVAIANYESAINSLRVSLLTIKDYFDSKNVTFLSNEPASFLNLVK